MRKIKIGDLGLVSYAGPVKYAVVDGTRNRIWWYESVDEDGRSTDLTYVFLQLNNRPLTVVELWEIEEEIKRRCEETDTWEVPVSEGYEYVWVENVTTNGVHLPDMEVFIRLTDGSWKHEQRFASGWIEAGTILEIDHLLDHLLSTSLRKIEKGVVEISDQP